MNTINKIDEMSETDAEMDAWKRGLHIDLLVWLALLILLGITFAVSFAPWGVWSTLVSFTVSAAKTVLIAYFYMHLQHEKGMTRIFALGGAAWLMILFSLTLSDYTTRSWLPYPSRWPIFVHLRPALYEGATPHTASATGEEPKENNLNE